MRLKNCLFILICAIFVVSCGTTKKIKEESNVSYSEKALFASLVNQSIDYKTISAKVNMNLRLPSGSVSSKAVVKMVKNEVVQISVQPMLGIEMFRLQLTKDSLMVVDKMGKRYIAESLSTVSSVIPAFSSVATFQALLLNRLFIPGREEVSLDNYADFDYIQEGEKQILKLKNSLGGDLTLMFDTENRQLKRSLLLLSAQKGEAQWKYDGFKDINSIAFPMQQELQLKYGTTMIQLGINFSAIDWNANVNTNFAIPYLYSRITLNDLSKMLSK